MLPGWGWFLPGDQDGRNSADPWTVTATAAVLPAFPSYEVLVAEFGVDPLADRDARLAAESATDPRATVVRYDPAVAAEADTEADVEVSACEETRAQITAVLGDERANAHLGDEETAESLRLDGMLDAEA